MGCSLRGIETVGPPLPLPRPRPHAPRRTWADMGLGPVWDSTQLADPTTRNASITIPPTWKHHPHLEELAWQAQERRRWEEDDRLVCSSCLQVELGTTRFVGTGNGRSYFTFSDNELGSRSRSITHGFLGDQALNQSSSTLILFQPAQVQHYREEQSYRPPQTIFLSLSPAGIGATVHPGHARLLLADGVLQEFGPRMLAQQSFEVLVGTVHLDQDDAFRLPAPIYQRKLQLFFERVPWACRRTPETSTSPPPQHNTQTMKRIGDSRPEGRNAH